MEKRTIDLFKQAHKLAYEGDRFKWSPDLKRTGKPEDWKSLWKDLISNDKPDLEGDCEDVALAIVDFCVMHGVDTSYVGVARIKTRGSSAEFFDHAVAVLLDGAGNVAWVSDCNWPAKASRKIKGTPYDYISAKALATGDRPKLFAT